jgi:hypothetical protein
VGVSLVPLLVEGALDESSLGRAFETPQREPVSALIIAAISEFIPFAPVIARLALAARLPAISGQNLLTEAGLLSYGPSYPEIFRRAAGYVSEIANGADPGPHANRAADEIRVADQSPHRQGAGPDAAPCDHTARNEFRRMMRRRVFITGCPRRVCNRVGRCEAQPESFEEMLLWSHARVRSHCGLTIAATTLHFSLL